MMYGYGNYSGWGYPGMMGGFFGGGFMMIIFWVLFIGLIVWAVREFRGKGMKSEDNSMNILKERYAKGEITKEQFESMKKDLSQ